jgi:hypothetical protein
MKWFTFKAQHEPGFRFNLTDFIFLLFLSLLSYLLYWMTPQRGFYLFPLYLGLSFFLFCNVFRIGNKLEFYWYFPLTVSAIYGFFYVERFWLFILAVFEPLKLFLIVYHIKKGHYIGIFYKRVGRLKAQSRRHVLSPQ